MEQEHALFDSLPLSLSEGFIDDDLKLCCYTYHQVFDRYHRSYLPNKREQRGNVSLKELIALHIGDYVVHVDHGVGRFGGLTKVEVNGSKQEAVKLIYRDNDVLLVNIHSLHRISKYRGEEDGAPKLHKLGNASWNKLKDRVKKKVKDIARDLIVLYAQRQQNKGFSFPRDTYLQEEMESSFVYEDTPDQSLATERVKEAMEAETPMDLLVCGDVGFGKTEVALRAAFKAVQAGKQVAVLVPTTVLAFQHFQTFQKRLAPFGVNMAYISRFKSSKDIKETLEQLQEGKIDILIGTHRIISKDVHFHDLGLLIVDEEQKFGVAVKERLKGMKVNLDTLTMSATPIPRTLQFSLINARELVVIKTPPKNRHSIETSVSLFNEEVIQNAINYEVQRNGQVFFVHNRIQNIMEVEAMVKRLCPHVTTVVAHGQMNGAELERNLMSFIHGDIDVLIVTTIVENGIDVPNANTMIINQAQNFGLSELHQIRGRVGRGTHKAFCYLIAPPLEVLSPDARRRIKALEEFSELGSGFNIALQDLDIRGAGNLLGAEQSGFISDIGYETYQRILAEAIQELRTGEFSQLANDDKESGRGKILGAVQDCLIETDAEVHFPTYYIENTAERLRLYRKMDDISSDEGLEGFRLELIDRFGPIPKEAERMFDIVRLRQIAIRLMIKRITIKKGKLRALLSTDPKFFSSPIFERILATVQKYPQQLSLQDKGDKIYLIISPVSSMQRVRQILQEI